MYAFILSLIVSANIISAFHLSPSQMYHVRGVLRNALLTPFQRDELVFSNFPVFHEWGVFSNERLANELPKNERCLDKNIQNLLYITHEKWAKKQALDFKLLHRYKCRDLSLEDLEFSSKIGLMKSAISYNGKTTFSGFSTIYVKSELLRTLTTHLSITSCFSQKERMQSNVSAKESQVNMGDQVCPIVIRQYIPRINSPTFSTVGRKIREHQNPLRISGTGETQGAYSRTSRPRYIVSAIFPPKMEIENKEFYKSVWDFVDTFDPLTKYVIRAKYDPEFKVRKSTTQIAEMMCCSEETVRKSVNLFSREFLEMFQAQK